MFINFVRLTLCRIGLHWWTERGRYVNGPRVYGCDWCSRTVLVD